MASTSHGLSVWANTCVKSPINLKTGLNSSFCDRNDVFIKYEDLPEEIKVDDAFTMPETNVADVDLTEERNEEETEKYFEDAEKNTSGQGNLRVSRRDEFYEKLLQLKEENQKTMEAYERLYQDKVFIESVRGSRSFDFNLDKSGIDTNYSTDPLELSVKGVGSHTLNKPEETVMRKPPPGKPKESHSFQPSPSKTLPQKSTSASKLHRPTSAPMERSHSFDSEYWQKIFTQSGNSSENFVIPSDENSMQYEKALAKVDKLWKDFKISEYVQRRHSFSSPRDKTRDESEHRRNKISEWRHRITIPQPFNMTIREALKEKKKTSAQEELERQRLAKQKEEEAECEKKFKAQPVPAHVYLPMYEEIRERNETRRRYVKQICQELLQSQVKPFNFDIREKEKKTQRTQSVPFRRSEITSNSFKARPVPKHIFNHDIDEKLQEEEELRKIRVKMRSRELLRESSLPPNMAAREQLKEQERKEAQKRAKLNTRKGRMRKIHELPDYDALYKEFKKELERQRFSQKGTVIEPFNFETDRIYSSKIKMRKGTEEDEKKLKENRWPFQTSRMIPDSSMKYLGALSNSLDYIPTPSTRAAELRSKLVKREKERMASRQKEKEEAEKRQKAKEAKLRRYLSEKTNSAEIPNPRDSVAERLRRIRKEDRERQEAYERELEEMNARVEQSPLLVEKFKTETARKAADEKFKKVLQSAGLDEKTFLSTKSSRTESVKSDIGDIDDNTENHIDNLDEADKTTSQPSSTDLTYTKSDSDK